MAIKLFKAVVVFTLSLTAAAVFATSKIEIDNDKSDCLDGWISMDITVKVDSEKFTFDPSCNFSFDKRFETKSGVNCKIEAGMCSSFSPEKRFEVKCDDGASEGIEIFCPKD